MIQDPETRNLKLGKPVTDMTVIVSHLYFPRMALEKAKEKMDRRDRLRREAELVTL